jgi:mannose-6-phosphate isomerase
MAADLYPFVFHDIFKEKIWGGRNLERILNKKLPPGKNIGESWEISGHGEDTSVIVNGPYRGKRLDEVDPVRLLGKKVFEKYGRRFPLLFKFIDAHEVLSVQVHPDDECAVALGESDPGKTEAWYIIHAEPGAKIYAGLKEGIGREDLEPLIEKGRIEDALSSFEIVPGDVIGLPGGTLHAIGRGVLLAEVQQNSDNTYRVYDWGRLGLDGKPRQLHTKKAKRAVKPEVRPRAVKGELLEGDGCKKYKLYFCDKFEMSEYVIREGASAKEHQEVFSAYLTLGGEGEVAYGDVALKTRKGISFLVPAEVEAFEMRADSELHLIKAVPV